ncbi:hypothetical protein NEHOM01_0690 [Nematocida homosporus]|uniref:uncharacterized protein n=1 Tax=Nematocida homosporus TaxID=1912981 RepID=UPI00221EEA68|nr:uncharacterized protein NEHOM01_0690 [Nematocida homosporus]KAI5185232.1 hypothetical protein NEHOM01_0690 [Nematocida homosporus]
MASSGNNTSISNSAGNSTTKTQTTKRPLVNSQMSTNSQPRTLLSQLSPTHNKNIIALLQDYTPPTQTNGTDYQMKLSLIDESLESTNRTVDVQVFLKSPADFPKNLKRLSVIVKIPQLNVSVHATKGKSILLDRKQGMFLFKVDQEGASFYPYECIPAQKYQTCPSDQLHIQTVAEKLIEHITLGPVPFPYIKTAGLIFTGCGYVYDIEAKPDYTLLTLQDMSTKELHIRLWDRLPTEIPKLNDFIMVECLRAKEVTSKHILCDVSRSMPFIWKAQDSPLISNMYAVFDTMNYARVASQIQAQVQLLTDNQAEPELTLDEIIAKNDALVPITRTSPIFQAVLPLPIHRHYATNNTRTLHINMAALKEKHPNVSADQIIPVDTAEYQQVHVTFKRLDPCPHLIAKSYAYFERTHGFARLTLYLTQDLWPLTPQ